MAKAKRGTGRRPSGRAVTGRLGGAFALGMVVMGGGLYLFDHTRGAADRGTRGVATRTAVNAPAAGGVPGGSKGAAGTGGSDEAKLGTVTPGEGTRAYPQAPFGEGEEVFETGARVYGARCAGCHGRPGRAEGTAGQYWGAGAARVAGKPAGELFEQIAGGVTPGMKGYRGELRETEIWDVALLLRNAGGELPDPVVKLLRGGAR